LAELMFFLVKVDTTLHCGSLSYVIKKSDRDG
jgi:hypothetical protein